MTSTQANPSIVMTSPQSQSPPVANPRRPPAKRSVSLLHASSRHPAQSKDASSDSDVHKESTTSHPSGASDSPSSLQALGGRGSSGESSNAERWFEKSNNEIRENSASFADNDPPFFMRNSSSSETPPDLRQKVQSVPIEDGAASLPLRTGLLHLGTDGSSTEDFRSVIDDLTIENKKLKRRLKKYEKLHDSHLKDEKLFEVRIHGLPAEKKRELEETLRKFASGLAPGGTSAFPPNGYASLMPILKTGKAASSQASLQHTDSAYASMSASGQEHSGQSASGQGQSMTPSSYPAVRSQNIHNYLHHIPEGLMPQQNPASMSERAKKKMVVRRMEQLFAGKGASAGGHQHSIQQEEVSQTAARNDRTAMEAAGQRAGQEGSREANIMHGDDPRPIAKKDKSASSERGIKRPANVGSSERAASSEQRPTRPLDLDPHRAQVPAENIRYMRQMGFSPRDPEAGSSPEDDHGWIYLNFLINMAQLHTINVTADFVRKALTEYSSKFEVSHDCRRVRWKGGSSITRSSDGGGGSSHDHTSSNTPDDHSPRKRQKLMHTASNLTGNGGGSLRSHRDTAKHAYTPLFFHRENSNDSEDSSSEGEQDESMSSPYPLPVAGDSSGMTSSGIRTSSGFPVATAKPKKQKNDDGPIIFYNNARFCTDLSGDRRGQASQNAPPYTIASAVPIGKQRSGPDGPSERRGPLASATELPEPMDIGDNPIPESMELSFPEQSPPQSESSKGHSPIDLEVTGIGGVWPTDNFSITVQSRHTRIHSLVQVGNGPVRPTKAIPPRLAQILRDTPLPATGKPARVLESVVASKLRELPPSALPPALNYMALGDDLDDEDDEDEDHESEAPESVGADPPSAAPQPVDIRYASSDEEDEDEDDDDEDEDDGEIDFLAAARAAEPEAVRRQEREYEANMAERLADEIPAGSSAATAGGGSGYASPTSGVTREEYRRVLNEARGSAAKQKRARAASSTVVNQMKDSSSDDSSAEKGSVKS